MAWTKSAPSAEWCQRKTSGVEAFSRASQYLGTRVARRVLEICGAPQTGRRKTRLFCPQGKQLLHAPRKRESYGNSLARRSCAAGKRTSRSGAKHAPLLEDQTFKQASPHAVRRGLPRHLSRRPNSAASPLDGALKHSRRESFGETNPACAGRCQTSSGHELDCGGTGAGRELNRPKATNISSTPMPLTIPRIEGCSRMGISQGKRCRKKFCSQKVDHGRYSSSAPISNNNTTVMARRMRFIEGCRTPG